MQSDLAQKLDLLIATVQSLQKDISETRTENRELKEQLLLQATPIKSNQVWFDPNPAASSLGVSSGRVLHEWRRAGKFRHKIHFRNVATPGSLVPRWQYHVPNCQKLLTNLI